MMARDGGRDKIKAARVATQGGGGAAASGAAASGADASGAARFMAAVT